MRCVFCVTHTCDANLNGSKFSLAYQFKSICGKFDLLRFNSSDLNYVESIISIILDFYDEI